MPNRQPRKVTMNASIAKMMGLLNTDSNGSGNYSSLAEIKNTYDQRRKAIEDNWDLPERAKALRLAQLKTELREAWGKTKQDQKLKADAELRAAWQKANPAPNVANMSPGQVQARQEVLEDIAAITESIEGPDANFTKSARGEAILDLYAKYHAQDYDLGLDTVVQRASKYLTADQAKELQQLEEYRKPAIAEARQNWEDLKRSQSAAATGQALMEGTFMQATALTSAEAEALHQAGQQAPNEGAE